jgi:hypothetical protein
MSDYRLEFDYGNGERYGKNDQECEQEAPQEAQAQETEPA